MPQRQRLPAIAAVIGIGAGATVVSAVDQGRVDVISQTDPAVTILEKDGKVKAIPPVVWSLLVELLSRWLSK